jgi:hypothetical protein
VLGNKRLLLVDNLVYTVVGVESGLDVLEDHDRAVSTSTTALYALDSENQSKSDKYTYPNEPIPMASWKVL